MAGNVQPEVRTVVQIGLKSYSFLLTPPQADQPLDQQWARQQFDRHFGVVKPVGGEAQVGLEAAASQPVTINYVPARRARSFHPPQHQSALAPVITGQEKEPQN